MMITYSNSGKELNGRWFPRYRLFSMSQTCSIGTRSGERLGQGNVLTLLDCKKFMERRAMCGRALACWKRKRLFLRMNSTTTGHKMSSHRDDSRYFKMCLLYTELMHLFLVCFVTVRLTYIFIDYPDCEYIIILNTSIVIYDFWHLSVLLSSTLSMPIFWNHHRQKACLLTNTRMIHTHMFTMNIADKWCWEVNLSLN